MICYTLECEKEHRFDSWFQSASAFDLLSGQGKVSCAVCGSSAVSKALMAPSVVSSRTEKPADLKKPASEVEAALAELRRKIEENSEYVGMNFAAEARAIHEGDAPSRPIYGEAHKDDAKALLEDGIPVAPLPFLPNRRTN